MRTIYPCLTTWPNQAVWQNQLKDINRYKLSTAAVFLTVLIPSDRQKLYRQLKKSKIRYVPHLHLRHDMADEEIAFFFQNYRTRQFNIHPEFLDKFSKSRFSKYILIETTHTYNQSYAKHPYTIDLAHLYSQRKIIKQIKLRQNVDEVIALGYKPAANHLNGIKKSGIDTHYINNLSEFDYLKKIPAKYLVKNICLEVGNPIREQLEFIKYLKKFL